MGSISADTEEEIRYLSSGLLSKHLKWRPEGQPAAESESIEPPVFSLMVLTQWVLGLTGTRDVYRGNKVQFSRTEGVRRRAVGGVSLRPEGEAETISTPPPCQRTFAVFFRGATGGGP